MIRFRHATAVAIVLGAIAVAVASTSSEVAMAGVQSSTSAAPASGACGQLTGLRLKDIEIASAESIASGAPVARSSLTSMYGNGPGAVASGLPAFCRVIGHIRPEPGSDIGFEVWLPASGWDGRMHGIGIGGFAGGIDYLTLGAAVKAGQAAVATDTGHSGTMQESGWAKGKPQSVRDYGWRAVHLSTVAAKDLINAYYGRKPDKSYFVGCSGGGRQGLMEASRFPEDYDGVLAGAPAANWTDLAMAMSNTIQAQGAPGAAIRASQIPFLQQEVLNQCDAIDGQTDGLVEDPRQCRFDASKLACGTSPSAQCFSPAQITALQRIHAGPRSSTGRQLAGGYLPSGAEKGDPSPILGWEGYLQGAAGQRPGAEGLANGLLQDLVNYPATAATFNFDRDPAALKKLPVARDLDASPNLSRFFARGGKVIVWHGWADAAIPPENTLRYYDALQAQSGGRAKQGARLFMVPGVQHCFGGTGPDTFGQAKPPMPDETPERNMITALQSWVEGKRAAPESFVARRGHGAYMPGAANKPERQRLLCAWPKRAVLTAGSDPDQAASYTCQDPAKRK